MDITPHRTQEFTTEAIPHLGVIRRVALRRVRERSAAEDITQEVYLIAWSAFDQYEPGTNCRAWLMRILLHSVQRHRRKEALYFHSINESFFDSLPSRPNVQEALSDPQLIGCVERLPKHLRAVIQAVDVNELSYSEAAETLGIPIGTVMSRLSRARKHLRSTIDSCAIPELVE